MVDAQSPRSLNLSGQSLQYLVMFMFSQVSRRVEAAVEGQDEFS